MSAENTLPVIDIRTSSLPIPERKGVHPFFNLNVLLYAEGATGRVSCSFDTVQNYLRSNTGHQIPDILGDPLAKMSRWQLVYPVGFDLSQILFIGKSSNHRDYIPIEKAEATIYFHRGAEDGYKPNNKPYTKPWKMEVTSVYPDSNGEPRILAVYYRLHTEDGDFGLQDMRISVRNDELVGREDDSDSIFGPIIPIPAKPPQQPTYFKNTIGLRHPYTDLGVGVITPRMSDIVLRQGRVAVMPFKGSHLVINKDGSTSVVEPRAYSFLSAKELAKARKDDDEMRKIHDLRKGVWEIGLNLGGTNTPWGLFVPDFLEKGKKELRSTKKAIET